ncbi:MAG TPA: translation initiation factor IF-3 [Saprospiraceae bacterium]|nr:translation initiation factor IF-3 [Saprospiraceae bacterium]
MIKRQKRPYTATPDPRYQFAINEDIKVHEVRLVGDNFDEISTIAHKQVEPGVYPTRAAKDWARELGLDLVMISPNAEPPVCRIIEFNKFLYEKKKKEKEIKAKTVKTVVKEIRFGPNTDEHDFDFKLRHARKFLEEGHKVKSYVHFRGRTIVFKERGELILLKFLKELEDIGSAEDLPRMEGRRMIVIVAPKKKSSKAHN